MRHRVVRAKRRDPVAAHHLFAEAGVTGAQDVLRIVGQEVGRSNTRLHRPGFLPRDAPHLVNALDVVEPHPDVRRQTGVRLPPVLQIERVVAVACLPRLQAEGAGVVTPVRHGAPRGIGDVDHGLVLAKEPVVDVIRPLIVDVLRLDEEPGAEFVRAHPAILVVRHVAADQRQRRGHEGAIRVVPALEDEGVAGDKAARDPCTVVDDDVRSRRVEPKRAVGVVVVAALVVVAGRKRGRQSSPHADVSLPL